MLIFNEDLPVNIGYTVLKSKMQMQRMKQIKLPNVDDIKCLTIYLQTERRKCFMDVNESYSFDTWKKLSSFSLCYIQLFNRRRAGEIEHLTLEDFYSYQQVDEQTDTDIFSNFQKTHK